MKQPDPWETLAAKARNAPVHKETSPPDSTWAASVAKNALPTAALGKPAASAFLVLWLQKFWPMLLAVALIVTTAGWLAVVQPWKPTPVESYVEWRKETLNELRVWLPLECEEAGRLNILIRTPEISLAGPKTTLEAVLAERARVLKEIEILLTPEQAEAFRKSQETWERKKGWR